MPVKHQKQFPNPSPDGGDPNRCYGVDWNAPHKADDGAGKILFIGSDGVIIGDGAFFWDNTNKRLGIGTTNPTMKLDVNGGIKFTTVASPTPDFTPLMTRMGRRAWVSICDPWIVVASARYDEDVAISYPASFVTQRQFPVGNYQWRGKIEGPENYVLLYCGGFEYEHGWGDRGIIGFYNDESWGGYCTITGAGGDVTRTVLSGQDWTVERVFKVEWSSAQVKFYVDGELVSTHTTNIPNVPMMFFNEVTVFPGAPSGKVARSYIRIGSLVAV
jgi:hypothetical protein